MQQVWMNPPLFRACHRPEHMEVRRDRGILRGDKRTATQIDGHFPAKFHRATIEQRNYRILH